MQERLLIVDDDSQLTAFLTRFLTRHGYKVVTAGTSHGMFEALAERAFDLIVLDLILPDEDGLEAARRLRKTSDVPVVMLTARGDVHDRIVGLELGADDYMTKPYEPHELLARVRSVLRRSKGNTSASLTGEPQAKAHVAGIELDFRKLSATDTSDSADLALTSTEFGMLKALVDANGDVLRREDILQAVYGNSIQATDRVIDTHMVRLRRKLAKVKGAAEIIKTVHGIGYKLTASVDDWTGLPDDV
ncbi:MAG: response regulator transcription factor [Paracoccaceae bacterium]